MFGVVKLNGFNKAAHNGQYSSDPYDPPFLVPIASQKYTNFNVLSLKRYIKSLFFIRVLRGCGLPDLLGFPNTTDVVNGRKHRTYTCDFVAL